MMRLVLATIGVVLLAGAAVAAQDAKAIETGKNLFTSKECTKCHMIAGKGNRIGKLDGVATKISAADMRKWLTAPLEMEKTLEKPPKVKMSSKIKILALKDADIDALVAYLSTLK